MAFYGLDEIIQMIVGWEEGLRHYYHFAHTKMKSKRSREIIDVLLVEQQKVMEMVKTIDPKQYQHVEFVKNIPDFRSPSVMPGLELADTDKAEIILAKILQYEIKLRDYYLQLRALLTFQRSKELLDTLLEMKTGQVKRINAFLNSLDFLAKPD